MESEGSAPLEGGSTDRAALDRAIKQLTGRVAAMVRDLPDTGVVVRGSAWTVGDTVAHLIVHLRLYRRLMEGGETPFTGRASFFTDGAPRSQVNEALLSEVPDRDGPRLSDLVLQEAAGFLDTAARLPEGRPVLYHFFPVEPDVFASIAFFHLLVHEHDIAKALARPFRIERREALLAVPGLKAVLAPFVDEQAARGLSACLELRIRGTHERAYVVFDDGVVTVRSAAPAHVDCHLSADPVALLLVGLGRANQWVQIARGKLVSWGRNPLLALRLVKLFPSPG